MASLKSFLPVLSNLTDVSVTALYERQRALVRLGLLPAPTKSGRNSGGAMATPGNVGIVLLSVLITDRLSEMDGRILDFLMLKAYPTIIYGRGKPGHCTITGEQNLYRALQSILGGRASGTLLKISVDRRRQLVHLSDADPEGLLPCTFGKEPPDGGRIQHLVQFGCLFDLAQELWGVQNPEWRPNLQSPVIEPSIIAEH